MLQCTPNVTHEMETIIMEQEFIVTTGHPDTWQIVDTMEEAREIQAEYLEKHPHEDVAVYVHQPC